MSFDISIVKEIDSKEVELEYVGNYTYNCNPMFAMARHVLGFEDGDGSWNKRTGLFVLHGMDCPEAIGILTAIINEMNDNQHRYKVLNPTNGWGDYETFLGYLKNIRESCERWPSGTVSIS